MTYLMLKACHLTSLGIWVGIMVISPLILLIMGQSELSFKREFVKKYRIIFSTVSTPAMISTWVFGGALMIYGNWFPSFWLFIKISLVLVFSALHGYFLRFMTRIELSIHLANVESRLKAVVYLQIFMLFMICMLVLFKPF